MKIAGVSMTFNDDYKLEKWREHYEEYKNELDYFIIVDNGSKAEYLIQLENVFGDSAIIIKRNRNGGCTAAYNDGIRYALEETDADAIAIIANDIKLCNNCLTELYKYLYSNDLLGIVSCAMLVVDSHITDNYGHEIQKINIKCSDSGVKLENLFPEKKYTDLVTGGFYMEKRVCFEKVGFQDEGLFMYGDELDTSMRMKKAGYKEGVTCKVYAWHCHINNPDMTVRKPAASYLITRNKVYLAKKYFGIKTIVYAFFCYGVKQSIFSLFSGIIKRDIIRLTKAKYLFFGGINGILGNMELNKYTKF